MNVPRSWRMPIFAVLPALTLPALAEEPAAETLRTDSPAPYVHRITLYDADGVAIDPRDPDAPPFSTARTCGKCHAYGQVHSGWHFNAGREGVADGRAGEPWIYTDERSGTQLPLSKRQWPGAFAPADVGVSDWELLTRFGAHSPGGGFGAPDPADIDASDESLRWGISGTVEVDCLFCHAASLQHDPAELSRQIERENFRWSATVTAGLATIRGDAKRLPDDFDPLAPPNPDYPDRTAPRVQYDLRRFDADDRVLFDLTLRAPLERCTFCHAERIVGESAAPRWTTDQDVHLSAGLLCTDCHRNGIDHGITRGYPGDPALEKSPDAATLSCRGCHLGEADLIAGRDHAAGRLGAPYPEHRGIPLVHFEKLTCTACHSGPWPQPHTREIQTAMNHGLGLPTRERSQDDPPQILAPVFARNERGEIAPHRAVFPAYWAIRHGGGEMRPVPLDRVRRAAPTGDGPAGALPDAAQLEQIAVKLATDVPDGGQLVYLRDGLVHSFDAAGKMQPGQDALPPYLWPIAHDVRPAGQSLGIRGCTDCHADDASIYFGKLSPGPIGESPSPITWDMAALRGDDRARVKALNAGFPLREAFKLAALLCAGLMLLALLRHGLAGYGARRRGGDA